MDTGLSSDVHQPVALLSTEVRNELVRSPSDGMVHTATMRMTVNLTTQLGPPVLAEPDLARAAVMLRSPAGGDCGC